MRVAAIDIGTNAVLMLVAEGGPDGAPTRVVERATLTRLGQGVDQRRRLAPEAVDRTLRCLRSYVEEARALGVGEVAAVGTSALRDVGGGAAFVEAVERELSVRVQVISGDEEARLTFAAALGGLTLEGPVVVVDVGGGSTEVIVGEVGGAIERATSLDVGSVRLTERLLRGDPPGADELARLVHAIDEQLHRLPRPPRGARLVGVAGTVTTLAAVAEGVVDATGEGMHGRVLSVQAIERVARWLGALDSMSRRACAGLDPGRADVIVAGAWLVQRLARWAGVNDLVVSNRGVRWGLAARMLEPSSVRRCRTNLFS